MLQSIQQETLRRLLSEMLAIAETSPDQFSASHSDFSALSDTLATLVKTPALPAFRGPQTEWFGETMVIL